MPNKTTKQLGLIIAVMIMTVLSIILINFNQQNKLAGFTVQTYAEIGENPTGTPLTTVLLSITPPAISNPIIPGQPVVTEIKQNSIRTPAYFMTSKDIRLEYDGSRYWFYREPSTTMQNTKVLYALYITNLPTTITGFDSITEEKCKSSDYTSSYSPGDSSIGRIGYYNKVTCFINENGIYGKAFVEEITKDNEKYVRVTTLEFGTSTSILPPTGGQYTVPCYKNTYEHIICKQTFTTTAAGKYTGSVTPNNGWKIDSVEGYYSPSNPPVWTTTCTTQPCTFTTTDYYANAPYISITYLSQTTTVSGPPPFEAPFPEPPDCDADYPIPPAYAPPCDVFNVNPSTNKARIIVNPIKGVYTDKTTQYVQNLKISTQQRGGYIWKEGYRYDASINNWIRFTFDQPGYKGSNWILDQAGTELQQVPLTAVRPDAPYANAILVFSCKKYGGKWRCGCTESDKTTDASLCEKWMMRQYTITLAPPPFAPPTPGGIATPAPTPMPPPPFDWPAPPTCVDSDNTYFVSTPGGGTYHPPGRDRYVYGYGYDEQNRMTDYCVNEITYTDAAGNNLIKYEKTVQGTNVIEIGCMDGKILKETNPFKCPSGCENSACRLDPTIDLTPPVRSDGQVIITNADGTMSTFPSPAMLPAGTTSAAIRLSTNEDASCKFGTSPNTIQYRMVGQPEFPLDRKKHQSYVTDITGLADGQRYNYYIKCFDSSGNENTDDYLISVGIEGESPPPTPPPLPGNYVICRTPPGGGATITGVTDPATLKSYCVDFAVLGDSSKTPMTGIDVEQALIGSKYTDAQGDKLECKLPCSHAKASIVKTCKDLTTNQYVFNVIDQC